MRPFDDHGIDALLPQEIALKAEAIGVEKTRRNAITLFVLGVLAGAFIALGAMFATTVLAGAQGVLPFGVGRLLAGVVFCLGLILVVVGGAELFTGNALMVMALAAGKLKLAEMLRAWAIVYAGNFVGALGTALLVFLCPAGILPAAAASPRSRSNSPCTRRRFRSIRRCSSASCATRWSALPCGSLLGRARPPTR